MSLLLTQPNVTRCRCYRRIFGGLSLSMSMQMGVLDRQLHFIAAVAFCQRSKDPGAWSRALLSIDRSGGRSAQSTCSELQTGRFVLVQVGLGAVRGDMRLARYSVPASLGRFSGIGALTAGELDRPRLIRHFHGCTYVCIHQLFATPGLHALQACLSSLA